MGLTETLTARLRGQGRTAQVDCGELGSVTVEALPPRELEGLLRGADPAGSVFYAACRELQRAGEQLRQAGQLYTPDGILAYVSQSEAQTAARAVLALSGWDGEKLSEALSAPDENGRLSGGTEAGLASVLTETGEAGQVSRETVRLSPGLDKALQPDEMPRESSDLSTERTQDTAPDKGEAPYAESVSEAGPHERKPAPTERLEEAVSKFDETPRETEAESAERLARALLEGLRRAKWVRGG